MNKNRVYDFETQRIRYNEGSAKWDMVLAEMGNDSLDVLPMSVADMEFKIAPEITTVLQERAATGMFGYTNPTQSYYDAVISWMHRRHNWNIKKEWILFTPGVVTALYTAVRAYSEPGDSVILQTPIYYPFYGAIKESGRNIAENPLKLVDGKYQVDFENLEKTMADDKVKMMFLCSPHNPVGRAWTREELQKIAELAKMYNVVLVVDEIHHDLVYPGYQHTVMASLSEEVSSRCVTLTAPSKTFNIAALQCSNIIISNPELREKYQKANLLVGIRRINASGLWACEAAYTKGERWLEELLDVLEENKQTVKKFLKERLPMIKLIEPEATYLLWLDCSELGLSKEELQKLFREKGRIYFDEGYIFGPAGEGYERFNIACPNAMVTEVLERMEKAIKTLK